MSLRSHRGTTRPQWLPGLPLIAVACGLTLAGCGGSSNTASQSAPTVTVTRTIVRTHTSVPTTPPTSPATTAPTAPATSPTISGTSPAAPACSSSQLSLSVMPLNSAAGNFYSAVILGNAGSTTCTLDGFPGVSFTDASGNQIGVPAARTNQHEHLVTLAPGDAASALLHQPDPNNFDPSQCQITTAHRLRVYPPNQTAALTVRDHVQVCSTSTGQTDISPMQPGTTPSN